jgi:predicted nucleic acid-binding protein
MLRFYIDTCIWRDYYENRVDRFRPLGEWAFRLLQHISDRGNALILSDVVIKELRRYYTAAQINTLLDAFVEQIIVVSTGSPIVREANILMKQRKVSMGDALHALLARRSGAILVTRDTHFLQLTDIVEVKKPEELL